MKWTVDVQAAEVLGRVRGVRAEQRGRMDY